MSASAVDANCIGRYQRERVLDENGIYHLAIETLLVEGVLILDEGGLCRQEWLDTAKGPTWLNLDDWINDLIANNKLKYIAMKKVGAHRKPLVALGVPKKDHKWFALCRDGAAIKFLTEDMDFFDPREKKAGESRRRRIMRDGLGPVRRFFWREIGTEVLCCEGLCPG